MKKWLFGIGIVVFLLSLIGLWSYFTAQNDKKDGETETTKAFVTDITEKIVATGAINPRKEVMVKAQISGVIDELYVEAGDLVTKGQQLARIELVPDEVNVSNAQANVELARLRYQQAKQELARQRAVNEQNLDVENARASLENAKREETRNKKLFDEGVISEQEYQQFQLDLELRQADFKNAQIRTNNSLRQLELDLDVRQQELNAAISNLQLLKEGVSNNSKQVANIVTATTDGMVLDTPVEEGGSVVERNTFNDGTTIASIADMSSLVFEGNIDESEVGKLREGMPLELTVGAIKDEVFRATLEFIAPKGTNENGVVNFEIRAAIEDPKKNGILLRAGYSANADIILNNKKNILAVKERDVIFRGDSTLIAVKKGDEFESMLVPLGISDGINVEVLEGLDTMMVLKVQK
ncbi:MAG: HlyD family efflux transporter periplasmic adaptor subunit [Bacteroidota bacterium]